MRAVELDVVERELGRLDLERILFGQVAQLLDVRVAEERVVVDVHLGVERQQVAALGHDERIDLEERRVGRDERVVERTHQLDGLLDGVARQPQRERQLASLEGLQAQGRVDADLEDSLGRLLGDLLDLHAAVLAHHQDGLARRPVDHQAQIELAADVEALLHQHAANLAAFRSGLMRDEPHPDHLLGRRLRLDRRLDDFHAAALAAAAGVNLGLDHAHAAAQPIGDLPGLFGRERHLALGNRHAVACKDGLRLILVNLHNSLRGASPPRTPLRRRLRGPCASSRGAARRARSASLARDVVSLRGALPPRTPLHAHLRGAPSPRAVRVRARSALASRRLPLHSLRGASPPRPPYAPRFARAPSPRSASAGSLAPLVSRLFAGSEGLRPRGPH